MSNLIEQILKMEDGIGGDAIIYQPKAGNGSPDYLSAEAIIMRIHTMAGYEWVFRPLMFGRAGSGFYGDIDYVVETAERKFGTKFEATEWVPVDYADPDFPHNLLPPHLTCR